MTNLLANKQLKFATTIRIVRILNFINSEHAGFRCASFFLVRKEIALHVSLESNFKAVQLTMNYQFKPFLYTAFLGIAGKVIIKVDHF